MKLLKLALLIASFALFATACNNTTETNQASGGGTQPTPAPTSTQKASPVPSPAAGEFAHASAYYAQNCAICHGDSAKGGTVEIEGKKLKIPSLVEGHSLKHTDAQYAKQIANGGDGMPAFKDKLKPEEIDEMVRYIRQKFQAGLAAPTGSATPAAPKG